MALLNGLYIFVESETPKNEIETVAHPVETGINITDHVRKKPEEISLKGEIVGEGSPDVIGQIKQLGQKGAVITYVGVNYFKNGQIMDFETEHTADIWGGCSFTMTIREVRFAKSPYDASAAAATSKPGSAAAAAAATKRPIASTSHAGVQQKDRCSTSDTTTHTVKSGETDYIVAKHYSPQGKTMENIKKENSPYNWAPGKQITVANRPGR